MTDVREDESSAVVLGKLLTDREETVAVAESCTGGLLCARITAVPGASAYFERGFVPYAYDANREVLGVTREALDSHGAVSQVVAEEQAQRVRDLSDTTWGISVTGLAGPEGGTPEKPVGITFIAIAFAGAWRSNQSTVTSVRVDVSGDRAEIRDRMVDAAISALIDEIQDRTCA